jgi:hypothetical protein
LEGEEVMEEKQSTAGRIWKFCDSNFFHVMIILLAVALVIPIIRSLLFRPDKVNLSDLDFRFEELREVIETRTEQPKLTAAIEEKKRRFLNLPNIAFFHYANEERIRNIYNDYFREPTVESAVQELVSEISGDVGAELPKLLEAKFGGKNLTRWISNIKYTDISIYKMFLQYQRETIKKGQVILDLELVDVELSQVEEFEQLANQLRQTYNFEISEGTLEDHKSSLKEKAAEQTLTKLETILTNTWVLIEGSFLITNSEDNFYYCTSTHPVSDYISDPNKKVSIIVQIPKPNVEAHFKQLIGKSIPLRVYGAVMLPINREHETWDFLITPLAVY